MKKILLVFAACAMFMACGEDNKPKTSEERCLDYAKSRQELAIAAAERIDAVDNYRADAEYIKLKEQFDNLNDEFEAWLDSLSPEEKSRAIDLLQDAYDLYPKNFPL